MKFNWKWPQVNRFYNTKPGILLLSVGLAIGFACGQVIHSNAENNKTSEDNSVPVKIHSAQTAAKTMQSELDALNRWRAAVENLSFSPALFSPFWSLRPGQSDWPFRDFEALSSDNTSSWPRLIGISDCVPRLESTESGNEVKVTAEVPGVDYKNLDVTVNDDSITIQGEKKAETEQQNASKKFQCVERAYGSFARTITLPCRIEKDKAKATLKNGVLTIIAPKSQVAQNDGKKLEIKPENS